MSTSTPVERIREAVAGHLRSLGAQGLEALHETILIHQGLFCGRKFQCDGYLVVWFIEEDEIKFFSPCGELLKATTAIACIQEMPRDVNRQPATDAQDSEERRAA